MNNVTTSSLTMQLSLTPLHCNFAQNPPFCRITPLIITFLSEMREIPQVLQRPRMPRDKKDDTDCSSLKIGYYHTFAHHSTQSVTLECTRLTSITRPTDLIWQCSRQVPLEVCKAFCPLLHQETTEMSPRNLQETSDHRKMTFTTSL